MKPAHDQESLLDISGRGATNHYHRAILRELRVKALQQWTVIHSRLKSATPVNEGTGADHDNFQMDPVISPGFFLSELPSSQHHRPMLDVKIANLDGPSALDASVDLASSAFPKVISSKYMRYRGNFVSMYKLLPLLRSPPADNKPWT